MLLLLAAACGAAATATPQPQATSPPTEAETPPVAAVPVVTPAPTSVPVAAPTAPSAKVILATSDWGNELFTDHDVRGEGGVYQRLVHDYFIHTAKGKGLVPGIAKSWSFTPNGLTWTFEVREGVKFHDGTELT